MMNPSITLIRRTSPEGPVSIALQHLIDALKSHDCSIQHQITYSSQTQGTILFYGLYNDTMLRQLKPCCSSFPESFSLEWRGSSILICGSDSRGLAYGLIELAERVSSFGLAALRPGKPVSLSPDLSIRGVDKFLLNSGDITWWQDENYWRDYLDRLLTDRFNRLTLVVGFDTAYFSPPYPFLFQIPSFPEVRLASTELNSEKALSALRNLGKLCHEYGLEFSFAIWQQIPWQTAQGALVKGLENTDLLCAYCRAGVTQLLLQCPEIDVLHFRVNHESGVGTQISAEEYWFQQIDGVADAQKAGRSVRLELRAKGMTDAMVQHAKELGLDVCVSTKYCCEHAGFPHHLTRMRTEELDRLWNFNACRRYSYADMLKKPRLHDFIYRLWNNGSTDLFTWGDPDYVRRFMASMIVGPADGFEVMPPLSYKGGHEAEKIVGWPLFDDSSLQPSRWEDDRYWLFYRLFGRIGYQHDASETEWTLPMQAHFGAAAPYMLDAISTMSKLLPLIVGFHFVEHPQLRYWPEMSSGAALFPEHNHHPSFKNQQLTYQGTLPSDEGLLYGIDEYVLAKAAGKMDGRYTPYQVIAWLEKLLTNGALALEKAISAGLPDSAESRGVLLDLKMLQSLGRYHQFKISAALGLSHFQQFNDPSLLNDAVIAMNKARDAWSLLSRLGTGTYHSNLVFAAGQECMRKGTWSDYLPEIDADLHQLQDITAAHSDSATSKSSIDRPADITPCSWLIQLPKVHPSGMPLPVILNTNGDNRLTQSPRLRIRHTNQLEGAFRTITMEQLSDTVWTAEIPAEEFVPEWDLLLYFESVDAHGDGLLFPGIGHPEHPLPYFYISVSSPLSGQD